MLRRLKQLIFGKPTSARFGNKKVKILSFITKAKDDLLKVIDEEQDYKNGLISQMERIKEEIEASTASIDLSTKTVKKLSDFLN